MFLTVIKIILYDLILYASHFEIIDENYLYMHCSGIQRRSLMIQKVICFISRAQVIYIISITVALTTRYSQGTQPSNPTTRYSQGTQPSNPTTRYSQGTLPSNPTPRPSGGSAVPGSSTRISMGTKKTTAIRWSTKKPGTGANKGKFLSNQKRSVSFYKIRPKSV